MRRLCLASVMLIALSTGLSAQAPEKVSFLSTDADLKGGAPTTITGYLYKPEGTGPFPAVIGLHGCGGLLRDGAVNPLHGAWGERLSKEGYLVLLPDSFGSRGHGDLCAVQPVSARPVQPSREIPRDNYGALAYLRSRPDVKPNSIAILGQSFGAASTFYTIAEGARPKELAAEQDFRAGIAFYPACQQFLALEPKWKPRQAVLFLMGEADNFTPPAPCKELLNAAGASGAPRIEAHWYAGAYHAFDHPNLPERVLTNVKLPPDGHSPTVGSNPEARADAIVKVKAFLSANLK